MIFVTYEELAIRTFTFRQKHCTLTKAFVNDTSILTSLSTDHSPVHLSLCSKRTSKQKGMDFGNLIPFSSRIISMFLK